MEIHRLRVLAVVNSLGIGGTERMLERLTRHSIHPRMPQYTVCALEGDGEIGARLRSRGVEVLELGCRGGTFRVVVQGMMRLRALLRRRNFHIIHTFLYRSHCAARLARLGLRPRIPLISSERCLGDNRPWLTRLVNRLTGRLSDRILAVSDAVRARIVRRDGIPEEKVTTVRNGIETSNPNLRARSRLRDFLSIRPDTVVLLFLGRLHEEKGPDVFLETLATSPLRHSPRWQALMVGDGPQRSALEHAAASLRLQDKVFFAGGRRRVEPWIDASDIVVLSSREEGMPVSAMEAMAKAKPVVATDVGGCGEVIANGETGLLVPPENPRLLAQAIAQLLEDPEKRHSLGSKGMRRVRSEFTIQRMVDRIVTIYHEMMVEPNLRTKPTRREPVLHD